MSIRSSLFACVVGVILLASASIAQNTLGTSEETKAVVNYGNLHELAKEKGGRYIVTQPMLDGFLEYVDLKSIARASKSVVIGSPIENFCGLSEHGRSITTTYKFKVEESFKGKYHDGDIMLVSLPGGRVSFEDGTVAQINVIGLRKMVNGNRYLLFLVPRFQSKDDDYILTGGSRGLFELAADGTVRASARPGIHALSAFSGTKQDEFLDKVKKAAESEDPTDKQ